MPATVFDKPIFPGAKEVHCQLTVTNTSGSYSHTEQDERITSAMSANRIEIDDPSVFGAKISIVTANGSYTISCAEVSGETDIKISFLKVVDDQQFVTSTEFDTLSNRIGDLDDLETEDQTSMVDAVNEVVGSVSSNTQAIANLTNSLVPVRITPTAQSGATLVDHCVYTVGNMAFVNVSFSLSAAPTSLQLFVSNLPKPKTNVPIVAHKNFGGGNYQAFLTTTGDIRNDYDGFANGGKYFVSCSYAI